MPNAGQAKKNELQKGKHSVKARHSAVYLRARLLKVINESINVIEKGDKKLEELLADAIVQDPFAGLQLISRFLPREQEINLHSSVDLHLSAVRDLVDDARRSIRDITPPGANLVQLQTSAAKPPELLDLEDLERKASHDRGQAGPVVDHVQMDMLDMLDTGEPGPGCGAPGNQLDLLDMEISEEIQ